MKNCPKCKDKHSKTGTFCGYKCSNSRTWTDDDKRKKSLAGLASNKVKLAARKSAAKRLGISLKEWESLYDSGKTSRQLMKHSHKGCKNCGSDCIGKKTICEVCRKAYYKYYRPSCVFDFLLSDYSEWFDFSLLKQYGIYKATNRGNNLNGISRDHLLSVNDGFRLGIDPEVMKHPANCRLLRHKDNQRKRARSVVTFGELLDRIELFDALVAKRLTQVAATHPFGGSNPS